MKKQLTLVMLGCALHFTPALNSQNSPLETSVSSSGWNEVKKQNGVKVYFREINSGSEKYLSIKFENTLEETVDFTWSLSGKKRTIKGFAVHIEPGKSISGDDDATVSGGNMIITLKDDETIPDFTITISSLKK